MIIGRLTGSDIKDYGVQYLNLRGEVAESTMARRFKSLFGAPWDEVAKAWNLTYDCYLEQRSRVGFGWSDKAKPKHLLWTLALCKLYQTEVTMANFFGVDPNTFRTWTQFFMKKFTFILDKVSVCVCNRFLSILLTIYDFLDHCLGRQKKKERWVLDE